MGDDGRIYVSESVIPIYKSLMPKATCATPNYFEAELLTDVKIVDARSLLLALKTFHTRFGIPHIVISAVSLPEEEAALLGFAPLAPSTVPGGGRRRQLICAGSSLVSSPSVPLSTVAFGIGFPELSEHYEGVGDVFSALILARFPPHPPSTQPLESSSNPHPVSPLARTAELAIASLQGVLRHTRKHALLLAKGREDLLVPKEGEAAEERVKRLRMVELRLVQSHEELLNPVVEFQARRIE